jgi:hypothetical protein
MTAYELLVSKTRKVEELQMLSEKLNRKFDRTDDMPFKSNDMDKEEIQIDHPNIIDLFDELAQ